MRYQGEVEPIASRRNLKAARSVVSPPRMTEPSPRILVVDDDDLIRLVATRLFRRHGAEVDTAASGAEGVGRFAEDPARYAMVLLDLTLPDLAGEQVFAKLREHSATVPVVFTSGHPLEDVAHRIEGLPGATFLQKPFSNEALRALASQARGAS